MLKVLQNLLLKLLEWLDFSGVSSGFRLLDVVCEESEGAGVDCNILSSELTEGGGEEGWRGGAVWVTKGNEGEGYFIKGKGNPIPTPPLHSLNPCLIIF